MFQFLCQIAPKIEWYLGVPALQFVHHSRSRHPRNDANGTAKIYICIAADEFAHYISSSSIEWISCTQMSLCAADRFYSIFDGIIEPHGHGPLCMSVVRHPCSTISTNKRYLNLKWFIYVKISDANRAIRRFDFIFKHKCVVVCRAM